MKIVICGAGIAGLALAHRLGTLGWDVVVLEKAPGPRTQGYMTDFFGPGYDAAEAMGGPAQAARARVRRPGGALPGRDRTAPRASAVRAVRQGSARPPAEHHATRPRAAAERWTATSCCCASAGVSAFPRG
ncbi:MAG: FAD-dependent oxidoreductase [Pseudonocardiaceae bacterium]